MGLEALPNIDPELLSWAKDLDTVQKEMHAKGWRDSNFGYSLGRYSLALDLHYDRDQRILIYEPSPEDQAAQAALERSDLPRFPILNPDAYSRRRPFIVAEVPLTSRALDSSNYPDQEPVTSHLGSIEIMQAIGRLIGRIHRNTRMLPNRLLLRDLALTEGNDDIIRLIPPLTLEPAEVVNEKFVQELGKDLRDQDPQNKHITQVTALIQSFRQVINEG